MNARLEDLRKQLVALPKPEDRRAAELLSAARNFGEAIVCIMHENAGISGCQPGDMETRRMKIMEASGMLDAAGVMAARHPVASQFFEQHQVMELLWTIQAVALCIAEGREDAIESRVAVTIAMGRKARQALLARSLQTPPVTPGMEEAAPADPAKKWWQFWR